MDKQQPLGLLCWMWGCGGKGTAPALSDWKGEGAVGSGWACVRPRGEQEGRASCQVRGFKEWRWVPLCVALGEEGHAGCGSRLACCSGVWPAQAVGPSCSTCTRVTREVDSGAGNAEKQTQILIRWRDGDGL